MTGSGARQFWGSCVIVLFLGNLRYGAAGNPPAQVRKWGNWAASGETLDFRPDILRFGGPHHHPSPANNYRSTCHYFSAKPCSIRFAHTGDFGQKRVRFISGIPLYLKSERVWRCETSLIRFKIRFTISRNCAPEMGIGFPDFKMRIPTSGRMLPPDVRPRPALPGVGIMRPPLGVPE